MSSASKTPSVPALERGLAILELIAQSKGGLTFSQLARHFDFPKSSVHCILLTFERQGYLQRDEASGRYMTGQKLVSLANVAIDGIVLREKATPLLRALVQATGMTVHLAIMDRDEVMVIAKMDRPGMKRVATWIGKRVGIHCTSLGKCFLAHLPDSEVDRLIGGRVLMRHNENTIVSPARLKKDVAKTRLTGYAMDDEEEEIGVRCIGAPVISWEGQAVAAISVVGTTETITAETINALIDQVKQTALGLSRQFGYLGDGDPAKPAISTRAKSAARQG
jgi:DNA-binding IclR family transcriptional regulator